MSKSRLLAAAARERKRLCAEVVKAALAWSKGESEDRIGDLLAACNDLESFDKENGCG